MTWPDLAVLELLVAVADSGGLGAGARRVTMAQPNASRAMTALEASLGVRLLERGPRGSKVTPQGALVVDWARVVLDAAREFDAATKALSRERRATLTVAASMTVAEFLVPAWLSRLRERYPEVDVALRVENSVAVERLVREGDCELGFVEAPRVGQGLRSVTVGHDTLSVVVAPGHPWARRQSSLDPGELARTPLIVREPGSGTRTTLDEALAQCGGLAPPRLELASNAAVRVCVASGAGPAVLSELAVAGALQAGELVAVAVRDLELRRTLRAVWRPPRIMDPVAEELVHIAASESG